MTVTSKSLLSLEKQRTLKETKCDRNKGSEMDTNLLFCETFFQSLLVVNFAFVVVLSQLIIAAEILWTQMLCKSVVSSCNRQLDDSSQKLRKYENSRI